MLASVHVRQYAVIGFLFLALGPTALAQPASARVCNEGNTTSWVAVAWLQEGGGIIPLIEAKYALQGWFNAEPTARVNVYQDSFARYFYLGFVQTDPAGNFGISEACCVRP